MTAPKRSYLPTLQSDDPHVFSRFLQGGLRGFIDEGQGRSAFGNAAPFIGNDQRLDYDLKDIYDCLNIQERLAFRDGLVLALNDSALIPINQRKFVAVNLIRLAGHVHASGVLDVLSRIVRAIALDLPEDQKRIVVEAAYDTVVAVATPSLSTRNCILDLKSIAHPDASLAPPTLLALSSADPEGLPAHLAALRPELDLIYGWYDPDSENWHEEERSRTKQRELLIDQVFQRVGPLAIANTLIPNRRLKADGVATSPFVADYDAIDTDWWSSTLRSDAPSMIKIISSILADPRIDLADGMDVATISVGDFSVPPAYILADMASKSQAWECR